MTQILSHKNQKKSGKNFAMILYHLLKFYLYIVDISDSDCGLAGCGGSMFVGKSFNINLLLHKYLPLEKNVWTAAGIVDNVCAKV